MPARITVTALPMTDNTTNLATKGWVEKQYIMEVYPDLLPEFRNAGIWTTGNNNNGQLGDSTTTSKSSPTQTLGTGTNWRKIAAGRYHTQALKDDGTLWATGTNAYGELGDNTFPATISTSSPVQNIITDYTEVTAGYYHAAGITNQGNLWLWGRNNYGQKGTGGTGGDSGSPNQTIAAGTNWNKISCGAFHTAAIKTDGTLWLWGRNTTGQLGTDSTTTITSPVQTIATGTDWSQVACGVDHTIAIKTDGTLWTWGGNTSGQLGDNTTTSKSSPIQVITGGNDWYSVSAGNQHSVATKIDASLWSFGLNTSGQLGDNSTTSKSSPIQTVSAGTAWQTAKAGQYFTAALKVDGTLWLWGLNSSGQIGDNTTINRSSPIQSATAGSNWKTLAAGLDHTIVIRDNNY